MIAMVIISYNEINLKKDTKSINGKTFKII